MSVVMMKATESDGEELARNALRADAIVVSVSGLALIAGARPIGRFLGWNEPLVLGLLGAVFLPCAGLLYWWSRRIPLWRRGVWLAAIVNATWVVGTAIVLVAQRPELTNGGRWTIAALAVVVAVVGTAEFRAFRRLR